MVRIWAEIKRAGNGAYGHTGIYKIAKTPGRGVRYSSWFKLPYGPSEEYLDKELNRDKILEALDEMYIRKKDDEINEIKRKFKEKTEHDYQKRMPLSRRPRKRPDLF